ncbi:hypothetical protein AM501_01245 [Aneurinibacillus migulanus]|nr:hypothetical protein TS64_10550 [Aneurinibacillus migulanus]KPD09978.1 hypothetical protein AM501_01245 [Aneurinibacillus migulanus]
MLGVLTLAWFLSANIKKESLKLSFKTHRLLTLDRYEITPVDYPYIVINKMHTSACSLVFFSQGRDTAALWRQGRTGKTSECFRLEKALNEMNQFGYSDKGITIPFILSSIQILNGNPNQSIIQRGILIITFVHCPL